MRCRGRWADDRVQQGCARDRNVKFLDTSVTEAHVRKILASNKSIRAAVAYWGNGAVRRLGIKKGQSVTVICDLLSGCCNPREIKRLRAAIGAKRVLTHDRLHAKYGWGKAQPSLDLRMNLTHLGRAVQAFAANSSCAEDPRPTHRSSDAKWLFSSAQVAIPRTLPASRDPNHSRSAGRLCGSTGTRVGGKRG
jgi:hypothetical protein